MHEPAALSGFADTIAAVATPTGRGAIAVIRVSGVRAAEIGQQMIEPWPLADRVSTLAAVRSRRDGDILDQALVTFFRGPASFTGEDVLEISTHGGFLTPVLVLSALLSNGAREALPGEFTRRAVLNGRLDIVQAEAIGDLIDAPTHAVHHAAVRQLDGSLSRMIAGLRDQLICVEALLGYDIDFPDEDDGPIPRERIHAETQAAVETIRQLLHTAPVGELLREGAVAVIAGAPNAGKSSLFNALLGKARAIVTDIPGTTRDALEALVDVEGWPVRLVDTAGLRETTDVIERLGVEVSEQYLADAHIVLFCSDREDGDEDLMARIRVQTSAPLIRVRTKADLVSSGLQMSDVVPVSAHTRAGLTELLSRVKEVLNSSYGSPIMDAPIITRTRHLTALELSLVEIEAFEREWEVGSLPAPVAAVHLRAAIHALEELIGTVDVDDVLDELFRSFCVGK